MADVSDRDARILDTAVEVFCRYGYAKTTMQDVAQAAGMSRAALYLRFPSKEELFRAGARRAHARALDRVDLVLAGPGDVLSRVDAAIAAYFQELMDQVTPSAHGGEILDASRTVTGDIVGEAHAVLVGTLGSALEAAAPAGEVRLAGLDATGEDIVRLLLAVGDALQRTTPDPQLRRRRRALFLRLVRAGLTNPGEGLASPTTGLRELRHVETA